MKIPIAVIVDLENEAEGLSHGVVTLQLHLRDFHLVHYKINREKSVVTLTKAEGRPPNSIQCKEIRNGKTKNEKGV